MTCNFVRSWSRVSVCAAAVATLCLAACSTALAQTPRVLYTWGGTGNLRQWGAGFGNQTGVTYDNNLAGIFRVTEGVTHLGASYSFSDDANRLDDNNGATVGTGGLDLYGLDAIEYDLSMFNFSGLPVDVAFYIQTTAGFNFFNTANIPIPADGLTHTYSLDISGFTAAEKSNIRVIGAEVREHAAAGDSFFQLREVRSVGTADTIRRIATHSPGSLESGFNGGRVNFDNGGILGNNGGQNQTGLSVVGGALRWTDLGNGGDPNADSGGAISYQNGTWPYAGNDFESRPHDNTSYNYVTFRMRATDDSSDPNADASIGVQGFTQTQAPYTYNVLADLNLPVDGQYHDVVFPLGSAKSAYSNNVSVNIQAHANNVLIDIDSVTYHVPEPGTLALAGLALLGIVGGRKRRSN